MKVSFFSDTTVYQKALNYRTKKILIHIGLIGVSFRTYHPNPKVTIYFAKTILLLLESKVVDPLTWNVISASEDRSAKTPNDNDESFNICVLQFDRKGCVKNLKKITEKY